MAIRAVPRMGRSPGFSTFQPRSVKIIVRRFDGRMALSFVPEGQADSSQARSAWVAMQRGPVPEGPVEVIVSPTVVGNDSSR
jgi:hypothetical protein